MRSFRKYLHRAVPTALLALGLLTGGSGDAPAQFPGQGQGMPETAGTAGLEARRQALFAQMLQDPANLDVAFEYAMISSQLGDLEAAISALERMLVFAPNLPRVQLELGVLYFRLGATDTARDYLEAAIAGENVPPAVRDRVNLFLARIDREERRLRVDGVIQAGVRYQSNANGAPEDDVIDINGTPIVLNANARSQADGNVFGLANVHLSWDLRNQGDLIEADIVTYNAGYFDIDRLNTNLIEATLGPSFSLGRFGLDTGRIGVYGILGYVALGGSTYTTTWGGGVRFRAPVHDRILYDNRTELRITDFSDSDDYPTVSNRSGPDFIHVSRLTAYLSARSWIETVGEARYVDADVDWETFGEGGGTLRATHLFFVPGKGILADDAPWQVSAGVGFRIRRYVGPDPLLNQFEEQRDDLFFVEGRLSVPLERRFSLFLNGQLRGQNSNYPTAEYTNAVVSGGISKRF